MTDTDRLDFEKLRAQSAPDSRQPRRSPGHIGMRKAVQMAADNAGWSWDLMAESVLEGQRARLDELEAAALASSSPALPEPPAPLRGSDNHHTWPLDGLNALVMTPTKGQTVALVPPTKPEFTPAEARLLASTLLAAADVAEEQQP